MYRFYNKVFGWKPLLFLLSRGWGLKDYVCAEEPACVGTGCLSLLGLESSKEICQVKGDNEALQVEILYSRGRKGIGMLRWGGSSPAPLAPSACLSPISYPVPSGTLPPESICPAPPQMGLTWLHTTAACPQLVGSATGQAGGGEGSSWATPCGWRGCLWF